MRKAEQEAEADRAHTVAVMDQAARDGFPSTLKMEQWQCHGHRVQYNADAATIQRHFDEAMSLKKSQKEVSGEVSALNSMMQQDGVHAGLLSHYCKMARMKPEKAALWLALDDFYRQALASRLPNPKTGAEVRPVPFEHARGAVAA